MITSTGPTSGIDDAAQPIAAVPIDTAAPDTINHIGYVDAYVESELVTRHQRTERAIRQARDQA